MSTIVEKCAKKFDSALQENQVRRTAVSFYARLLVDMVDTPVKDQLQTVIKAGAQLEELAIALDLSVSDLEAVQRGVTYPYVQAAWYRYMHSPKAKAVYVGNKLSNRFATITNQALNRMDHKSKNN